MQRLLQRPKLTDPTQLDDLFTCLAINIEESLLFNGATPGRDYNHMDLYKLAAPFALQIVLKTGINFDCSWPSVAAADKYSLNTPYDFSLKKENIIDEWIKEDLVEEIEFLPFIEIPFIEIPVMSLHSRFTDWFYKKYKEPVLSMKSFVKLLRERGFIVVKKAGLLYLTGKSNF